MKWASVEPARGEFDWRGADALVAFAKAHGQKVRGHTLVWHSQLPPWLIQGQFSRQELRDLMVAHIKTEAGRYKGEIYAWDVVNEPFANDGEWRKSIWWEAMGPDYVAIALQAARAADPDAKLYINDYGVETAGPKMSALHDLVASLKRDGVPIDGVGLQSHFVSGSAPADLAAVMADFAALGVDVAVTELDLRILLPASKQSLLTQADDYGSVVRACRATARCVGVTTWGIDRRPLLDPVVLFRLWRGAAVRRKRPAEAGGRRDDCSLDGARALRAGGIAVTARFTFHPRRAGHPSPWGPSQSSACRRRGAGV